MLRNHHGLVRKNIVTYHAKDLRSKRLFGKCLTTCLLFLLLGMWANPGAASARTNQVCQLSILSTLIQLMEYVRIAPNILVFIYLSLMYHYMHSNLSVTEPVHFLEAPGTEVILLAGVSMTTHRRVKILPNTPLLSATLMVLTFSDVDRMEEAILLSIEHGGFSFVCRWRRFYHIALRQLCRRAKTHTVV